MRLAVFILAAEMFGYRVARDWLMLGVLLLPIGLAGSRYWISFSERSQKTDDLKRRSGNHPARLFAQIAPQQRAQFCGGQHRDGFTFDGEKFLLAEFGERARKRFADCAEFRRQHALGHCQFDFHRRFTLRIWTPLDEPVG